MTAAKRVVRCASDVDTLVLRAHATALATRHYGCDELALVSSLRATPTARTSTYRHHLALAAALLGAAALGIAGAELAFDRMHPTPPETKPASIAPPPIDRAQPAFAVRDAGVASPLSPAHAPAAATPPPRPAQVVDLLAHARYREALVGYEQLARAEPDNRAYAVAVAVLRAKLHAHCSGGDGSETASCPAVQP